MPDFTGPRDSVISGSANEDRQVRYVDERTFLYAPQYAPFLLLKGGIMPGPNGERIKVKGILDSGFVPAKTVEWYEKDLQGQDMYADGAALVGATSIPVDNGSDVLSKVPRRGDILEVIAANTGGLGEQMYVQSVSVGATEETLTVVRGVNGTTAIAVDDDAQFRVLSNAQKEFSLQNTIRGTLADKKSNNQQIEREDWGLSRSDDRIRLYGGRDRAESMSEAAVNHVRLMERQLMFGRKNTATRPPIATDGSPVGVCGGMRDYIVDLYGASASTGRFSGLTHGGTVSADELMNTYLRYTFTYGNVKRKKIFLGGSVFGVVFNKMAETNATIRTRTKQTAFGVQITEILCAFGMIDFLPSGAIEEFRPTWGVTIDPENLKFCYLDNTFMVDNSQLNDADGYKGYFLTEFSLKVQGIKTHTIIDGVTGAA